MTGPVRVYTADERRAWEEANTHPLPIVRLNIIQNQMRSAAIQKQRMARGKPGPKWSDGLFWQK